MELLPVIYNSLLIVAALFVITVAISYISYKIKRSKGLVEDTETPETYKSVFHDKRKVEAELKPHYKTKDRHPAPQSKRREDRKEINRDRPQVKKEDKKIVKKEAPLPARKHKNVEKIRKPKPELPKETNKSKRIERITRLSSPKVQEEERETKRIEKLRETTEEIKNKKKLKSIDDDPLKKYVDSSDDDFHPLKTDD